MSDTDAHPPQLRPLASGETHLTPAVVPERGRARHLREKLAVLGAFAEQALVCEPGFDAAPALAALAGLAEREHPQAFRIDDRGWHAPWLGWGLAAEGALVDHHGGWPEIGPLIASLPPPWQLGALLALAFDEDLLLLDAVTLHPHWMVAALPGFWAPESSLGRPWSEPLPPAGHQRISMERSPTPRLHAHPRRTDAAFVDGRAWWRRERCTCWPLPGQAQVLVFRRADTEAVR